MINIKTTKAYIVFLVLGVFSAGGTDKPLSADEIAMTGSGLHKDSRN
jgi:hypothetical protein